MTKLSGPAAGQRRRRDPRASATSRRPEPASTRGCLAALCFPEDRSQVRQGTWLTPAYVQANVLRLTCNSRRDAPRVEHSSTVSNCLVETLVSVAVAGPPRINTTPHP